MEFTVRKYFGFTKVFINGNVAASFTGDLAGRAGFGVFLDGARAAGASVYDADNGQYLVGTDNQISALNAGGAFPIAS